MIEQDTPRRFPEIKDLLLIVSATIFLFILIQVIVGFNVNKLEMLLLEVATIIPAIVYLRLKKYNLFEVFRLRPVTLRVLGISALIGLGLSVIVDEMDSLIQMIFPMPDLILQAMEDLMRYDSATDLILLIITVVFVAGIAEEMLFRGLLQGTLEQKIDATKAVMSTAFIFALVHFNPWWFVEILILGVLMGVVVWRTGSIFPAVAIHIVNNGLSLYMANLSESQLTWYRPGDHVAIHWLIIALLLVVRGFYSFYKWTAPPPATEEHVDELQE